MDFADHPRSVSGCRRVPGINANRTDRIEVSLTFRVYIKVMLSKSVRPPGPIQQVPSQHGQELGEAGNISAPSPPSNLVAPIIALLFSLRTTCNLRIAEIQSSRCKIGPTNHI